MTRTVEDIILEVKTPRDAQDVINHNLVYSSQDIRKFNTNLYLEEPKKRVGASNGANVQGLRLSLERKMGICRDGALAAAAMLKNKDYRALNLYVWWVGGGGHSVFIYHKDNKIGSCGIHSYDYREAIKDTYQQLAQDIAVQFGKLYAGFSIYDFTPVDIINGTNNGLILSDPFLIKTDRPNFHVSGELFRESTKFRSRQKRIMPHMIVDEEILYTPNFFQEYVVTIKNQFTRDYIDIDEKRVLERLPNMLPTKIEYKTWTVAKNFSVKENKKLSQMINEEITYNINNGRLTEEKKFFDTDKNLQLILKYTYLGKSKELTYQKKY